MDIQRALSLFLLLVYVVDPASCINNGWRGSNFTRQTRKVTLNDILLPPPPPPRLHTSGRTGRLTSPPPAESSGYFARLMSWFNPFGNNQQPPPPLVPPARAESSYHNPKFLSPPSLPGPPLSASQSGLLPATPSNPLGSSLRYPGSSPLLYDRPPVPVQPSLPHQANFADVHQDYSPVKKEKNCNPCNKVPWIPVQGGSPYSNPSYGPPSPPQSTPGATYLPQVNNFNGNYDGSDGLIAAASHEVRQLDFSYVPPLFLNHDVRSQVISPLPNPHLYPGPMPPLFKAEPFGLPRGSDIDYVESPLSHLAGTHSASPSSIQPIYRHREHPSNSGVVEEKLRPNFAANNKESIYFGNDNHQGQLGIGDSNTHPRDSGLINNFGYGTSGVDTDFKIPYANRHEVSGHANLDQRQQYSNSVSSIGQHLHDSHLIDQQKVDASTTLPTFTKNHHLFDNVTPGSEGLLISNGLDHRTYTDDLSSSGSVAEHSHTILQTTIGNSGTDSPIYFEQSSLLDLTKKIENETELAGLSVLSDVFIEGSQLRYNTTNSTSTSASSHPPSGDDNRSGAQAAETTYMTTTQFHSYDSNLETAIPISDTTVSPLPVGYNERDEHHDLLQLSPDNRNTSNNRMEESASDNANDMAHPPSLGQSKYLWPSVTSTSITPSSKEIFFDELLKSYESIRDKVTGKDDPQSDAGGSDELRSIGSVEADGTSLRMQGAKRNKQVQVIIPYTSQYNPIPFHPSNFEWTSMAVRERTQPRKMLYPSQHNYITQESWNEITTANPSKFTKTLDTVKTTPLSPTTTLVSTTTNSISNNNGVNKRNNTIDVHRLQKNIDNWIIQEYSLGTTPSTILPDFSRPYLLPSKKIPDEYLTTTEPDYSGPEESVKTYALAGFSFNEVEHDASASDRIERPRLQIVRGQDARENPAASPITVQASSRIMSNKKKEIIWHEIPVSTSPHNEERVYIVTPQPVNLPSSTTKQNAQHDGKSSKNSMTSTKVLDIIWKKTRNKSADFESIERAYQVLPQAVNNLAVASTGPESTPLWGIMEHEEFASLDNDPEDEHVNNESHSSLIDVPLLYSGHSKVSKARR